MEILDQKQKIIIIVLIALAIGIMILQYINSTKDIYTYDENLMIEGHDEKEEISEKKIIVHITGAVKKNGVVEVKENARINDVIEAAGGITEDADLTDVNLAYAVEDGQKIYIPLKEEILRNENKIENTIKEVISSGAGQNVTKESKTAGNITNINKASLEELKLLPGIR